VGDEVVGDEVVGDEVVGISSQEWREPVSVGW